MKHTIKTENKTKYSQSARIIWSIQRHFRNMIRLNRTRLLSTARVILQQAANTAKASTTGSTTIKSSCPVGTSLNLGIKKGKQVPTALEDGEYPEWLWTVLDDKSKVAKDTEQEMSMEEKLERRRRQLRKENRSKIKQNNFISQL